jgi:peptidyl-prolyl cis-trans isomerase SurA
VLLDGIAGIVDDEIILRSQVWARARKFKKSLDRAGTPVPQATLEAKILDRLIDDILVSREARLLKLTVDAPEVEGALDLIAQQNKITKPKLLEAVVAEGLTQDEYKEEIRRQILEGKWLRVRMQGRISTDEAALAKERDRLLDEMRKAAFVEVRL